MRGERLFIRGGALAPYDQDDRRAEPRVGDAESHGFVDQPRSDGGVLDLGRADAIARGLYHRLVAADEAEQTLGIAPPPLAPTDLRAALARSRGPRPEPPRRDTP